MPAFTPVTLLTGFLGSGKTTLLKRLLRDPMLSNAAVLINEFGEVGLDHELVERIDETTVLLKSGCLCCTIRGELADAIRDLHARRETGAIKAFDRLVIESTGLADPFPVLTTLKADPVLRHHFRAGPVVATIDAMLADRQLAAHAQTKRQIAIADRIVLTKTDLASPEQAARVVGQVRLINPDAAMFDGQADAFEAGALLGEHEPTRAKFTISPSGFACDEPALPNGNGHTAELRSFVLTVDSAVDWTSFGIWLAMLLNRHGDRILRVKGMLNLAGEDRPVAIHGVQQLVHPPVHMEAWPAGSRQSRIVFILDGIEPALIRRSFEAFCLDRLAPETEWRKPAFAVS